jgi:hypothetical protein
MKKDMSLYIYIYIYISVCGSHNLSENKGIKIKGKAIPTAPNRPLLFQEVEAPEFLGST